MSADWDRRFVFYRFYHRSVKFACPDWNGLCPRPSICGQSFLKSRYLSEAWIAWSATFRELHVHCIRLSIETTPITMARSRWSNDRGHVWTVVFRFRPYIAGNNQPDKWTWRSLKIVDQSIEDSERYLLFTYELWQSPVPTVKLWSIFVCLSVTPTMPN